MSDSHSSGGGGAGFITVGLLTIPAVAIANSAITNRLIDTYGKIERVPAAALEQAHDMRVLLAIILFIGLGVCFPLGIWALAKTHLGGH